MTGPKYTYGRAHHIRPNEPPEDDEYAQHWTPQAIADRNAKLREENARLNAEYARKFPAVWGERAFPDATKG